MCEWRDALFSELCDITRGASPRPIHDFLGKEGMPWIKIADATSLASRFIEKTNECIKLNGVKASVQVFPGDLILSNSATPGLPKFVSIEACIHDGWMLLRNFKGLDKHYAYWLLLNERKNLVAQGNGSVFTNLKTDILKSHRVKLPDIGTQKAIAGILDEISTKIELNQQITETLEAIARLFFKDWFVDFGPTRAKAEGRPPYLAPELWSLFPDALDDADKPMGWNIESIGNHMVNFDSKRVPVAGAERTIHKGIYPYHGATSVMDYVDDYLFDGIFLLIGEDGSVVQENGMAFTQYVSGKIWVNNHAHVLQGKGAVTTEQLGPM